MSYDFTINRAIECEKAKAYIEDLEKWETFELVLKGPITENPFIDVEFSATFTCEDITQEVDGFYDGNGIYRVRYMPDKVGRWTYHTNSNCSELNGHTDHFECVAPSNLNHGPVTTNEQNHFQYADGTPFFPVGTTCYEWTHQGDELEEQTLETLRHAPFNKVRMLVFPKEVAHNESEPLFCPYEKDSKGDWELTKFNVSFFQHLERRIQDLCDIGVEADVILFHPYDKGGWGFDNMGRELDVHYIKYIVSRISAYKNVWWSLANEFDLIKTKNRDDWETFGQILQEKDPYNHLRSVHNWGEPYDYSQPWVTHSSYQTPVTSRGLEEIHAIRATYQKAMIVDECLYEGNLDMRWGNITAEEMIHRCWLGTVAGCYVTHGETYTHPEDIVWVSRGGVLHGRSPERIAFLKKVLEDGPAQGIEPIAPWRIWRQLTAGRENEYYLIYLSFHQPAFISISLPEGIQFSVDILDTWEMTITPLQKTFEGESIIELPSKPYMAVRIKRKSSSFM